MDERLMFEKFHEALDVDPRPGAYERMRGALTKKTFTPRRRAAFHTRWTKMGFRLAAAIVLVVVAVTAGAVFFAARRVADRNIPAGPDAQTVAYEKLIWDDDTRMGASYSNHCGTIDDGGCPAAAGKFITALQQWLDDLNQYSTPSTFVTIDAQMRLHLNASISDVRDVVTAQQAGNQTAMTSALNAGIEESNWIDPTALVIYRARLSTAADYVASVRGAKTQLAGCTFCAQLTAQSAVTCASNPYPSCDLEVSTAKSTITSMQDSIVLTIPPTSLREKDAKLQGDLARADSALIALRQALRTGDLAAWDAGRGTFGQALAAVSQDIDSIVA